MPRPRSCSGTPGRGSIHRECNRWWFRHGDFTSAGENVLATSYAIFPVGMLEDDIAKTIVEFVAELDSQILGAYSVRLLDRRSARQHAALWS